MRPFFRLLGLPFRFHFWGSLAIVLFANAVISIQIADRFDFASSKLYQDVTERWGAPIVQPEPSVRWVESGSVFNSLESLPLARQSITVDATMNYRKRGLVYFSGFDFAFRGAFEIRNEEGKTIDLVFVFPIQMSKNQVLLSELDFRVDGVSQPIDLAESADRLVWTGRLADGEALHLEIGFRGRGLDSFTYRLDPALPVRDFELAVRVAGGDGFDYAQGVVPATQTEIGNGQVALAWSFPALESGVPVGVRLPREKTYDRILGTMIRRSWATFVLFFVAISLLAFSLGRRLRFYESYLLASQYAFFFFLLAYFAAYVHFYIAFPTALAIIGLLITSYLERVLGKRARRPVLLLLAALLAIPTLAVILEGYTGLIYTLEILAGLVALAVLTTRPVIRDLVDSLGSPTPPAPPVLGQEKAHAT